MKSFKLPLTTTLLAAGLALASSVGAQQPAPPQDLPPGPPADAPGERPPFGPGGPPRGFGPMQGEIKLVEKFDKNGNERLELDERKAAREFLAKERAEGRMGRGGFGGFGRGPRGQGRPRSGEPGTQGVSTPDAPDRRRGEAPPWGRRENQPPPEPGRKITPEEVKNYRAVPLYDLGTLRTVFLEFEAPDWEKELMDFHGTDVEVPAKFTVDGKTYENVGVHFRGMSSFMMVGEGRKHSLNLSVDFVHDDQRLGGYRTLNLLNSAGDPTMLRAVLYHQIARDYIPSAKANWMQVVINGESWGVYVNVQQFNKDFIEEWFDTKKGARWKAPGRPNGNSGLEYLGDDVAEYKKRFEIKSKDDPKSWESLIELCRVLNQTPADQLEEKLSPILDIDGALKFLALENVFINTDGYWTRASDYNLYQDEKGRFHIIPHDVNETFRAPEGPGMRRQQEGDRGGRGVELDPFAGADDARKPLLSKLLAVPALRLRYTGYVRQIAEEWLDWNKLGPLAKQYQALIADEVKADTRKLASYEQFENGVAGAAESVEQGGMRGPGRAPMSLKSFVEQRRAFLLNHPEIQKLSATASGKEG